MALIEEAAVPAHAQALNTQLIVTPLTEAPEGASDAERSRWDRTCDCCGKWCRYPRDNFYPGQVQRTARNGQLVIMFFGVCEEHRHGG